MANFYATIARYYDAEHFDKTEDLELYTELVEEYGGTALVIGGGTGRVMIHIAQAGCVVHGIEQEEAMLERAREKLERLPKLREKVVFHQGNALTVEIAEKFQQVIIPYNTLMHFHTEEQQLNLLRRIHSWLKPGGILSIDLPNAGEAFASQDTGSIMLERSFLDPETGHLIMQQSVSELDRVEQLMYVTWIYDEVTADGTVKRTIAPVVNRYFFYPEMRLLLMQAKFEVEDVFGDFDGSSFEDGCPRMIVLAKPV